MSDIDRLFEVAEAAAEKLYDTQSLPYIMSVEVWKDIPGFEGVYQVSSFGNVKNIGPTGKNKSRRGEWLLKPMRNGKWVCVQLLRKGGIVRRVRVCALVAELFLNCQLDKVNIIHIDRDPFNNRADNLAIKSRASIRKRDSKQRQKNMLDRRAIIYLESEGVSHALLARAYAITEGAITRIIQRHEAKLAAKQDDRRLPDG